MWNKPATEERDWQSAVEGKEGKEKVQKIGAVGDP